MKCFNFAPSNLHTRGFTLIELMIVVAIIATLLSLAIPAYRDYTIRARVGEGVTVAASAKAAVSETCQTNPGVVPTNSSTGWSFSSSTYVTSVVISNTCAQPWIIVRTRNTGAEVDVVLSLDGYFDRGSGRIHWNCHRVRGRNQHIPDSCRDGHQF